MNKKAWLDTLHYNHDKQQGNLELAYSYMDKEGNPKFSKWKKYLDCDDKFVARANNRSILPNELVLDIEQPERFSEVLENVKSDFEFYSAYKTGSKGYHIHLFFDSKLSSDEKRSIISEYRTDEQKGSDRCLIAIENVPHWKTGNLKTLIEEAKGINKSHDVRKEYSEQKSKEEANKIKAFLQEERQKYESLGCGFNNGVYYFGTKVFKDGQSFNAVVTSDKKLYIDKKILVGKEFMHDNEIRNQFGLNYKDDFYDESLDNIFSAKAINKWLFENCDNITLESIFYKIIEVLKKYIYLDDERKYQLLACYRIAGFFMPVWKARARLFLYAELGAAKSRLTQIMHNIGFNSVALGDWTLAYLKAIIESTRGETHIDDFETLPEEQKNASIRLVKVGYMRGFKAGKMSEGNKRKPEVNDLFNTTTLNNTEGLDFISYDRCITIRMPKISMAKYDKEPDFKESIWQELRDELYILGLKHPEAVKETYENLKSDKIKGRLFSIIKPELAIAKLISNKIYANLEDYWSEEIEQRQDIDYESDWEFLALKQIYKLLSPLTPLSLNTTLSPLTPLEFKLFEEIVKPIGEELYGEEFQKKKRSMSITIGNILTRNPIFKKRILRGKKVYRVNSSELNSFLEAKRYLKPILDILGLRVDRGDSGVSGGEKTYKPSQNIDFSELDDKPKENSSVCALCGSSLGDSSFIDGNGDLICKACAFKEHEQ